MSSFPPSRTHTYNMRGEQYSIGALSLIVCVISNTLLVLQHPKGTAYLIFYVFLSCDQARRPPHEARTAIRAMYMFRDAYLEYSFTTLRHAAKWPSPSVYKILSALCRGDIFRVCSRGAGCGHQSTDLFGSPVCLPRNPPFPPPLPLLLHPHI